MATVAKRLNELGTAIQPLMNRLQALPTERQAALIENLLGAYVGALHEALGGDEHALDFACGRAHRLLNDAVLRQEAGVKCDA